MDNTEKLSNRSKAEQSVGKVLLMGLCSFGGRRKEKPYFLKCNHNFGESILK